MSKIIISVYANTIQVTGSMSVFLICQSTFFYYLKDAIMFSHFKRTVDLMPRDVSELNVVSSYLAP
jgi:hypothetical protein